MALRTLSELTTPKEYVGGEIGFYFGWGPGVTVRAENGLNSSCF